MLSPECCTEQIISLSSRDFFFNLRFFTLKKFIVVGGLESGNTSIQKR